jgi:hypothetical protein
LPTAGGPFAGGKLCVGARLVDACAKGFDSFEADDDVNGLATDDDAAANGLTAAEDDAAVNGFDGRADDDDAPKPLLPAPKRLLAGGAAPNWNMLVLRLPPPVGSWAFFSAAAAAPKLNTGVALNDVVGCGADPNETAGGAPKEIEGEAPKDTAGVEEAPKEAGGLFAPKAGLCVEEKTPPVAAVPPVPDGGMRRFGVLILGDKG